jgi:hypothetical protein
MSTKDIPSGPHRRSFDLLFCSALPIFYNPERVPRVFLRFVMGREGTDQRIVVQTPEPFHFHLD